MRLALLALVLTAGSARADGMLLAWSPTDLDGMTEARWNAAKQVGCGEVAAKNLKVTSWPEAYEVVLAANANATCKEMLSALAAQLADTTAVKLAHTRRLIVWERITSGDILFEGKGMQIDDDLFTVAGRANWVLRTVAKKNFGFVTPGAPKAALTAIQARWKRFLADGNEADVPERYPSTEKGLSELRSPAAIEALIASLKPSPAKDAQTATCLKTIYKLDKMPAEPDSPARMCNSDVSANAYLKVVTDVPAEHPYAWWAAWWKTNGGKLTWSAAKSHFVAP